MMSTNLEDLNTFESYAGDIHEENFDYEQNEYENDQHDFQDEDETQENYNNIIGDNTIKNKKPITNTTTNEFFNLSFYFNKYTLLVFVFFLISNLNMFTLYTVQFINSLPIRQVSYSPFGVTVVKSLIFTLFFILSKKFLL